MKKLILALSFLTLSSSLYACPQLSGTYFCVFGPESFSRLTVKQWQEPANEEITNFTFKYHFIDGEPDVVQASRAGIPDSQGWISYCSNDRLISVYYDGSFRSDIYVQDKRLIRAENGKVKMECGLVI